MATKPKLNVYIDGFNLYYNALKGTSYKWLDVRKLCGYYFPAFDINKIKYFTALLKARPLEPDEPLKQQIYLRALKTIPKLQIILGSYQEKVKWLPLVPKLWDQKKGGYVETRVKVNLFGVEIKLPIVDYSANNKHQYAPIYRTEEKGSDVNLATHLLWDAHNKDFEAALVLSNDSDIRESIRIVKQEMGFPVYILNPDRTTNNGKLKKTATYVKQIRVGALSAAQFPDVLKDKVGEITKPVGW